MKKIIFTLLLIGIVSTIHAQKMNFDFSNSSGRKYNSETFSEQLEKEYNASFKVKIILLLTSSKNDSTYLRQEKILTKIDAERFQIIYVVACKNEELTDRYYTSRETAKKLMGETDSFRVYIVDAVGKLKYKSDRVISQNKIKELVNE